LIPLPPNDSINPDHVSAVPENNKTCEDIPVKIVLCEQTERSTTCTIVSAIDLIEEYLHPSQTILLTQMLINPNITTFVDFLVEFSQDQEKNQSC
jgi:hypothetical protein